MGWIPAKAGMSDEFLASGALKGLFQGSQFGTVYALYVAVEEIWYPRLTVFQALTRDGARQKEGFGTMRKKVVREKAMCAYRKRDVL